MSLGPSAARVNGRGSAVPMRAPDSARVPPGQGVEKSDILLNGSGSCCAEQRHSGDRSEDLPEASVMACAHTGMYSTGKS